MQPLLSSWRTARLYHSHLVCTTRLQTTKGGLLAGEMLDLAYTTQLERDLKQLMIDADIFGIAFFGDGATIHKCPLINLFASALHCPAILINIIDCTARLVQLNLQVKRLYRTFGSGSNHKPYAFFMQHSKTYNKGRRVGLLRSAELKAFITRAANDVKDKTFWKRLFVLLRALFPLLKLLRCADSNKPNMD
ncbi:hypothetical protein ACHAW5_010866 [Stephanodiscus triporus]|uniref:Uncharacterized protein n=1 Tax=Stephanodiscus triporus TaxID=2934178 RepID=A0ABD3MSN7_9STRA